MEASAKQVAQSRFWRKFLRLTRGRVRVIRALEVLAGEEKDPEFKAVADALHKDLEEGRSLSEAMARHESVFSPSVLELVKTAEKCGAWDEILQEIADGLADGTFD